MEFEKLNFPSERYWKSVQTVQGLELPNYLAGMAANAVITKLASLELL
jgi:hypothetical protein